MNLAQQQQLAQIHQPPAQPAFNTQPTPHPSSPAYMPPAYHAPGRGRGYRKNSGRGGYHQQGRHSGMGHSGQKRAPGRANRNQRPYWAQGANTPYQNPPSMIKRHNNWNYCYTHGYDIADDHQSHCCDNPCWNHNWQATRVNPMGGSKKNINKSQLPAQNMVPYQNNGQNNPYQQKQQYPY